MPREPEILAFPGRFSYNCTQLLGDCIGTALAAHDLCGFPLLDTHNPGKFFATLLAVKFVRRHATHLY